MSLLFFFEVLFQKMSSRICELLVKHGVLTSELHQQILDQHKNTNLPIISCIIKFGGINEVELVNFISKEYRLPVIDLEKITVDKDLIRVIPHNLAIKHNVVPVSVEGNVLTLVMLDPSNIVALNDIKFMTGCDIRVALVTEAQFKARLDALYEVEVSYEDLFKAAQDGDSVEVLRQEEESLQDIEKGSEDAPVVKLVNALLADAVKKRASDIHIEPYEKLFRVRFRIDGVLYEIMKPPLKLKNAITSRLKIMSDLDIAERRLPQDGRIKLKLGHNREMDFRVSVLPGLFGEKVVLRLLDKQNLQTDMTKLGFNLQQMNWFKESIDKPFGMVLVTGPTGSGKTTTLYSALSELNKITVNISTAEDPVEFNLAGINQVQMHEDIGLNFAAALRSFLRQDPDVIMVGEIRDYETAEIAIKASLTGHLVLSTLHTNDAPATINRLLNMGVEPFLVSSSINLIAAQRLARRICEFCKEEISVNPEVLVDVGIPAAEAKFVKVMHGKGCSKCSNTGYKGRVALYEIMPMFDSLKELVLNGASSAELKRQAIKEGVETLRLSGLRFLKEGITTIEEVLRVTVAD